MGASVGSPVGNIQKRSGERCQNRTRHPTCDPCGTAKFKIMAGDKNVGVGPPECELLRTAANFSAGGVIRNPALNDTARALEGYPLMIVNVPHLPKGVKVTVP